MITLLTAAATMMIGCEDGGDMKDQPRYEAMEASSFFEDGASARLPVAGTVSREEIVDDEPFVTGRRAEQSYVDHAPVELSMKLLRRGRQRYDIYCSPCHGYDGYGKGIIVQRGYTPPPSLHEDRLRRSPDGYLFSVITHGAGRMPPHAAQVQVSDRWAIIAYLRALQVSQHDAGPGGAS
jgi:hypothetical protein